MYMLAGGTGGFVIVNTSDLLGGMQKIAKEMNEFYLIGYTPPPPEDGMEPCHSIRVKVDHNGYNVRARSGYCHVKTNDVLAQTATERTLETWAGASQAGTISASMQAPYFFIRSNVARVNVAMEIPGASLRFEKEKGKLRSTVDILGVAYKADGTVGARFSDTVKIDFDNRKEVEEFRQKPYHYENQFNVASGEYNLKVVLGGGMESFGKIEQPLTIDPYDVKKFSVSALALSTRFLKTSEGDQAQETALIDDRTPLIADGYRVTPAGSVDFGNTDTAAMYFEIYEPGLLDAEPAEGLEIGVQVRAFDAKGAVKFDTGPLRAAVPKKGGNPSLPFAVGIPVATFEPGTYNVELTAMDSLGNKFQRTATIHVH
jgi:hypothetical protein